MPSPADISRFLDAARDRLQAPLAAYYGVIDTADASTPRGRIAITQATVRLSNAMRDELRNVQIEAALIGGNGDLTPQARQTLQSDQRQQLAYMQGFMADIDKLSREAALARAQSYTPAVAHTISDVAILDLPPLPVKPGDKSLACNGYCRCSLDIQRLGAGDYDVTWNLHAMESCPDCIRLSQAWRPLRIRNGAIVSMKAIEPHDIERIAALVAMARLEVA